VILRSWAIAFVLFLVCTQYAAAQTGNVIAVRSGEHPTFSRLVFEFGRPVEWQLSHENNRYSLQFSESGAEIDLSKIYQRMPRTRLHEVTLTDDNGKTILLETAIDHHVEVFAIRPGVVVVDVLIGAAPEIEALRSLEDPEEKPENAVVTMDSPALMPDAVDPAVPAHHLKTSSRPESQPITPNPIAVTGHSDQAMKLAVGMPDARVLAAQEILVEQLGRAMTQGIIEPSEKTEGAAKSVGPMPHETAIARPQPATVEHEDRNAAHFPFSPETSGSHTLFLDHLNLEAATGFDRSTMPKLELGTLPLPGQKCMEDGLFDVGGDLSGVAATEELGNLRRALIGEFDRVDPDILDRLVRLQIGLGFGVEAANLIKAFPFPGRHQNVLLDLAKIVETGNAPVKSTLASQFRCPGAAALWAILARPRIPPGETPDAEKLQGHFAELPIGLRRRIGPALATRLLEADFPDQAQAIARLISRAGGEAGPEFALLSARLDLVQGNLPAARAKLEVLVKNNDIATEGALIALLGNYIETATAPPDWLIEDTASRAFQAQFSENGPILRALEIRARALAGDQNGAFVVLSDEVSQHRLLDLAATEIASDVFLSFSFQDATAPAKVETVFRYRQFLVDTPLMDDARRHVAELLLGAGLPDSALELMQTLKARPKSADSLLRAKIHLRLEQPAAALDELSANPMAEAKALRLQALSQLRDYESALRIADDEQAGGIRRELAWRGGIWELLARENTGIQ